MEDEGPVLTRVLGTRRGRRLALAIEAELVALVATAAAAPPDRTAPEAEKPRRGTKVSVVFAGLGSYGRLLVHKTAERFEGLESFSIGGADNRRTVVLAAHSATTAAPFLRYADFVAKAPPLTQRPAPATEATPGDTTAVVPVRDEPPGTAGAQRATTRPAREPRGVYVPPSRRDPATAVGGGGRGRGGLYVPPARRHRDEAHREDHGDRSPTAAESGRREVVVQEEEGAHTTKRRRGRGFDEEEPTTTTTTTTTRPASMVDEELEEVLDRHDAELKPLVDEAAFTEWAAASAGATTGEGGRRGSPARSSPDPWASLNRGRRDRRSENKRPAHEEEPDPEVVVIDYPAHVVELYDVEPSISDQELANLLFGGQSADATSATQTAGRFRRVNQTTALAAFASDLEAQEAMVHHTATGTGGGQFKLRPLAEANQESKAIRGVGLEVAKSVVPRPPTDARVARRMLVHALGLSPKRQNTTDD